MSVIEIVIMFVVAAACGAIGQAIAGASRGGLLVSIVLGFIGAALGSWLARTLELPPLLVIEIDGKDFPVIWAVIGSALFVAVIAAITSSGKKRR